MEIECRVVRVLDAQKFNGKNGEVVKYGFVCEYGDKYVKQVMFEVFGVDKWSQMESLLRVGEMVNVKFDISSREWNGRWFTSLGCYRVDGVQGAMQVNQSTPVPNAAYNQPSVANANAVFGVQNNDNLPF